MKFSVLGILQLHGVHCLYIGVNVTPEKSTKKSQGIDRTAEREVQVCTMHPRTFEVMNTLVLLHAVPAEILWQGIS